MKKVAILLLIIFTSTGLSAQTQTELNIQSSNSYKKVDNEFLPAILIGKTAYVPEKSFTTIDEAVELVKKHLIKD